MTRKLLPNADLAIMEQAQVKGRAPGTGNGSPTDLNASQLASVVYSASITGDPTGFSSPEYLKMDYDYTTQIVTLSQLVYPYWLGRLLTGFGPATVWASEPHDDVTGHIYRLYYDGNQDAFIWLTDENWPGYEYLQIATVFYGVTDKYCIRECHGFMPWQVHRTVHDVIGTYREKGGVLGSYTPNSTTVGNRRPTVTECTIIDEDIPTVLPELTSDLYTQMFIPAGATALTEFTIDAAEIVPVLANNPYYNQYTSGLWKQTLMANNSYMCVWLVGIPVSADATSQKYRFVWVQGQTNGNLASQTALTPSDINIGTLRTDATELVFLAKIIIRYTGGNWDITSVTNLTGSKWVQIGSPAGAYLSTVATDATLTGDGTLGSPLSVVSSGGGGKYAFNARLTLEQGAAIPTADQAAKGTLYLTPYLGSDMGVYNGSAWETKTLTEISLSLAGLGRSQAYTNDPAAGANITLNMANTAGFIVGNTVTVSSSAGSEQSYITTVTANTSIVVAALTLNHTTTNPLVTGGLPYDIFVYNNAGTLTLEALAWTDSANRATALTLQDGVYVKTGDTTRRYCGTICTTMAALAKCDDTLTSRLVWNMYNRSQANLVGNSPNATHTYTTQSWRAWNAGTALGTYRVNFILGLADKVEVAGFMTTVYVSGGENLNGVGIDSSTTPSTNSNSPVGATTTNAIYTAIPSIIPASLTAGVHYLQAMEFGRATSVSQRQIAIYGKWIG